MKKGIITFSAITVLAFIATFATGFLIEDLTRGDKLWRFYGWPISCFQRGGLFGSSFYIESASRFIGCVAIWFLVFGSSWLGTRIIRRKRFASNKAMEAIPKNRGF
jgi:hypothetical protein